MELRVIENKITDSESEYPKLTFQMGLFANSENEYPIMINNVQAKIRFTGNYFNTDQFKTPFSNLSDVFKLCYDYTSRVESFRKESLLFSKLFIDNYQDIYYNHKENIRNKIAELEKQLDLDYIVPDLKEIIEEDLMEKINEIQSEIDRKCNRLDEYKETSKSYLNLKDIIDKEKDKLYHLKTQLNKINNTDE
jgi:hypothetical protein